MLERSIRPRRAEVIGKDVIGDREEPATERAARRITVVEARQRGDGFGENLTRGVLGRFPVPEAAVAVVEDRFHVRGVQHGERARIVFRAGDQLCLRRLLAAGSLFNVRLANAKQVRHRTLPIARGTHWRDCASTSNNGIPAKSLHSCALKSLSHMKRPLAPGSTSK